MSEAASLDQPDDATLRLAGILATVAGAQAVAHLLGVGVRGIRVDFVNLLALWAAVALYQGRRWGRTALLTLSVVGVVLGAGFFVAADVGTAGRTVLAVATVFSVLQALAVAYTLPEEGVALGLPEALRPVATSAPLHLLILVAGLVGVFT